MKTPKRVASLLLLTMLLLSGCQEPPETAAVVSKNDGTFAAAVAAENDSATNNLADAPKSFSADFTSTDGKVFYSIQIDDAQFTDGKLPVLRVTPHILTEQDAKRAAETIFGDARLFETTLSSALSKSEIEDEILRWTYACTEEAIRHDYGAGISSADLKEIQASRQRILESYKKQLETAPEIVNQQECQWTFYPSSHYMGGDGDIDGTYWIRAETSLDGNPYTFWVSNRNEKDFCRQSISAYLKEDQIPIEEREQRVYSMSFSQKPDEQQCQKALDRAQEIIEGLELGEWAVASIDVVSQGFTQYEDRYMIEIVAQPVFNGIAVTKTPQLDSIGGDDEYSANYYNSSLYFLFGKNATMVTMLLESPLDTVETVNENIPIFTFEELMNALKNKFSFDDADSYNPYRGEIETGRVEVTANIMELGLTRIKIKNEPTAFYMVPSITVRGSYNVYDKKDNLLYNSLEMTGHPITLLTINAVDETIINTVAGY